MKNQHQHSWTRIASLALLTLMAGLMTGCMSFHGDQLTKLNPGEKLPAPVAKQVRLDLHLQNNGKPLVGAGADAAMNFHAKIAQEVLAESGLFGQVQIAAPGSACQPGEYVLRYEINNWGNKGLAAGSGFLCGLTLFAFPAFATDHYTVQAEVRDWQGKNCWSGKYEDKLTTVIWIGFFPCVFVPPCYPMHVLDSEMRNIYRHSFQDMQDGKTFYAK